MRAIKRNEGKGAARRIVKIIRQIISFLLILSLTVQSETVTALAWSDARQDVETGAEDMGDGIAEDRIWPEESTANLEVLCEVEGKRGEFSKEYQMSDNSRVVMVYPQQIHYETEEGTLAEIDNSLIRTEAGYENGSNSYELVVTDNADSQGEVIYREDGYEIAWQMIGLEKQTKRKSGRRNMREQQLEAVLVDELPAEEIQRENGLYQTKQSKVVFDGYENGVHVEYAPAGDGVKENIILNTRECGNEYTFCVHLSGLEARLSSNNEIEFYDKETDEVKYYFPAPFLIDQQGEVSYGARYELLDIDGMESGTVDGEDIQAVRSPDAAFVSETDTTDGEDFAGADVSDMEGTFYIRIVLDEQWLDQAVYPVTLDPVLKQTRAKNLLDYGCIASDGTRYDTLYVGRSKNTLYRSFIRFDLPVLEKQCVVSEAMLYLDGTVDVNNTHYLLANTVTQEWYNKAKNKPGKLLGWSDQPAMGDLLDYGVNAGSFNITKAVREWQSGEQSNFGIAVSAYNETADRRDTIRLKSSPTLPYLKIVYRTATGLEDYWGTHSVGAGSAGTGYINDYTGALTVVNTDVATAGKRLPMTIRHVYNSNTVSQNGGWRLNYEETIKIPLDTVDVVSYPYVYTDGDGTQHYFKKCDVTILQSGASREVLASSDIPPAQDEDGLQLYIVPVNNQELKEKYPLKLTDKSGSVVKYFDRAGRLAMITDANQYENVKNGNTKERNSIIIEYENYGNAFGLTAFDQAIASAQKFRDTCYASGAKVDSAAYVEAQDAAVQALDSLKQDPYAVSDYLTAKKIRTAASELAALTDRSGTPSISTAKTKADAVLKALKSAKTQAQTLPGMYAGRIRSVTDAVGNKAMFTYNAKGMLEAVTDPAREDGKANRYAYDSAGNLTRITFADGRKAIYTYDGNHLMTSQQDHDGYRAEYTYRAADGRIVKVSEAVGNTPGQTYGITYHADNTTAFRFSGVDDIYGNEDDLENIHVFDELGRTTCVYSKSVKEHKILGATACTYVEIGRAHV